MNAGAKFVDFFGWLLPVQYSSILNECRAVRTRAGLFDISHMAQVWVQGSGSLLFLQQVMASDIGRLKPGVGRYTVMCREDGGIVDDLYVFCCGADDYLLILNASRENVDLPWLESLAGKDVLLQAPLPRAAIALQGPAAEGIVGKIFPDALSLEKNRITECIYQNTAVWISRTGYTGEDGFELFFRPEIADTLVRSIWQEGEPEGLMPCGLGARDTLRLEMGYPLYGHELSEQTNPLQAGIGWVVHLDKKDFIGRQALERSSLSSKQSHLTGIILEAQGVPREGDEVLLNGEAIGAITSGGFSPTAGTGIALAYLPAGVEGKLYVKQRGREIPARVHHPPFVSLQASDAAS